VAAVKEILTHVSQHLNPVVDGNDSRTTVIKKLVDGLWRRGYIDRTILDISSNLDEMVEAFHRVATTEEDVVHQSGRLLTENNARNERKKRLIRKILLAASDAQTMTGM